MNDSGPRDAWSSPGQVRILDQRLLPHREEELLVTTVDQLVSAIETLAVRGAPALGLAGALGVAVAMQQAQREGWAEDRLIAQITKVRAARPTAVNLAWGVDQAGSAMTGGLAGVLGAAQRLAVEDVRANRALSRFGADWLAPRLPGVRPWRALTHCNAGALATTGWGTALGVIREVFDRGRLDLVYVDETRPLCQGSRLTAWELAHLGIAHRVLPDAAAAALLLAGQVDFVVVGADRIARNGDTANKIGTLAVALAAHAAGVPFVVAAPRSTIDRECPDGSAVAIEFRAEEEVLGVAGQRLAPVGTRAWNPAFDVTPAAYISAIVTEAGVFEPASGCQL